MAKDLSKDRLSASVGLLKEENCHKDAHRIGNLQSEKNVSLGIVLKTFLELVAKISLLVPGDHQHPLNTSGERWKHLQHTLTLETFEKQVRKLATAQSKPNSGSNTCLCHPTLAFLVGTPGIGRGIRYASRHSNATWHMFDLENSRKN